MGRRLLNAREVAARLNVQPWRVYDMTRTGTLPHVRLGRTCRYDPAAIEAFIADGGTGYPTSSLA